MFFLKSVQFKLTFKFNYNQIQERLEERDDSLKKKEEFEGIADLMIRTKKEEGKAKKVGKTFWNLPPPTHQHQPHKQTTRTTRNKKKL